LQAPIRPNAVESGKIQKTSDSNLMIGILLRDFVCKLRFTWNGSAWRSFKERFCDERYLRTSFGRVCQGDPSL